MKEGFRVKRNPSFCIIGADSGFRRTAGIHPRLRVSAGLNFAVILLSKAMDVGRDHLIHRKRSPFPLICTHFFGHFYFSPKGVFLSWMLP